MSRSTEQAELHDRALDELRELGLAAAREVQARLLAADDAREACDLSLAFNRISRAVRQTIALQAKLGRDRKRQDQEDAVEARRTDEARASRRKAQVRAAVERVIWTEAEDDEAERLVDELDDLISEEALYEGFAQEPVEAHIARICADLGISPPRHPGEGDAPNRDSGPPRLPPGPRIGLSAIRDDGQGGHWRSSA